MREGRVEKHKSRRQLQAYLFNDLLLFTEAAGPAGQIVYRYVRRPPAPPVSIHIVPDLGSPCLWCMRSRSRSKSARSGRTCATRTSSPSRTAGTRSASGPSRRELRRRGCETSTRLAKSASERSMQRANAFSTLATDSYPPGRRAPFSSFGGTVTETNPHRMLFLCSEKRRKGTETAVREIKKPREKLVMNAR